VNKKDYATKNGGSSRKRKSSGGSKGNNFTFVNISLNSADKEALAAADIGADGIWDFIAEQVDNGYKLSFNQDRRSDGYLVTMSGVACRTENIGKILTGRGSSLENAVISLMYKWSTYCVDGVFPGDPENGFGSSDFG
jgi:hypothetical protein